METNAVAKKEKSGSLLWWIIGAAGVVAIFLLSSFTASSTTGAADAVSPCASNQDCLKGYWKWQIIKGWYQDIVKQATTNNQSVAAQLESTAKWIIAMKWEVHDDFAQWETMVTTELTRVKAITPSLTPDDARYIAIENILTRLTK